MSSFLVSARKYRPALFDTVVGQQHVTETLKNAVINQHIAHAYLFCGPRGVGKTSCARIFAKAINCLNVQQGEPCGVCEACVSFQEGGSLNLFELDAASNNSVDDIRTLVEQVRYPPQLGVYKVYIIDEVHMLSTSAFNAFLKTLEEPPAYAIFILATTEKYKILPTILSRCQTFEFKKITPQHIATHLQKIAVQENIVAASEALQLIAEQSDGALRDALSLFDKLVSFTNGQLTYQTVAEHLNVLDETYYFKLFEAIIKADTAACLVIYDQIYAKGFEGDIVLNGLTACIRNLLVCQNSEAVSLLGISNLFQEAYIVLAQSLPLAKWFKLLNHFSQVEHQLKTARNKRLHVEIGLLQACGLLYAPPPPPPESQSAAKPTSGSAPSSSLHTSSGIALNNGMPAPVQITAEPTLKKKSQQYAPSAAADQPPLVREPTKNLPQKDILSVLREKQQANTGIQNNDPAQTPTNDSLAELWTQYLSTFSTDKNAQAKVLLNIDLKMINETCFSIFAPNELIMKLLTQEKRTILNYFQTHFNNKNLLLTIEKIDTQANTEARPILFTPSETYTEMIKLNPQLKELKEKLNLEIGY